MIIIDKYDEIESKGIKVGDKFEIHKLNKKVVYRVIESKNFEGCFELLKYVDNYTCRPVAGSGSLLGCVKLAYNVT